mgnify:CR=1 FL=1
MSAAATSPGARPGSIALSLVSHTNAGKTTLARTLLGRDIGEVRDAPHVTDLRGYGMLAAIDLEPAGAPGARGYEFQKRLFDHGLHLKATGDCVIVAPPLIAEPAHVDAIVDIVRRTLQAL